MRCDRVGEVGGAGLAEDLADRVEQDRRSSRAGAARRARPRPARGAGPSPLRRRTGRRRPSGAGRGPTRAGRGPGSSARPCSWIRPGMLVAERPVEHRREERQDVDLEGHGSAAGVGRRRGSASARRRRSAAVGVAGRRRRGLRRVVPARRLRPVRVGRASSFGGRRSSDSASTTISPRRGAKIRMKARTAGRSNSPNGPPSTTKTSVSPTR